MVVQKKVVVKVEVVEPKDAELENINARHTKDVPNIVVVIVVIVARPTEDAVNLGIDNFLIILYIMRRTRHTRKRHTRRKHKRKRTRRRRTRRRTRGGSLTTTQVFGGGYKEGLILPSLAGGAKSTYGVSDYPPGFSKFLRRDKRIVDKMKRKSKKHKRRHRKH